MAPDLWTCTPCKCLSVRNEQGGMKKESGFYIPPALLFSSVFVQQPWRRSSVRFQKVLPTSCCVLFLEIKACVLDSVCVIQDNMLQLYEWAAKEFGGLTKGSHGLSFMAEILGRAKALSVIYDWAWLPPRFISDSSNCSYNLDDVLPEYRRVAFRTHIPGTSHVVLPGPYLFAVLAVNTHPLTQTDCPPELKPFPNGLRSRACRWIPVTSRDGAWPQKPFKWCLSL